MSVSKLPRVAIRTGTAPTRDGAEIAYQIQTGANAHGVPIVVGLAGIMSDWDPLAPYLALSRPVVLLDNRDVLIHLGIQQVALLGWSLGGLIVQHILAHPIARVNQDNGLTLDHTILVHKAILAATFPRPMRLTSPKNSPPPPPPPPPDTPEGKAQWIKDLVERQYFPSFVREKANQPLLAKRTAEAQRGTRPQELIDLQIASLHHENVDVSSRLDRVPAGVQVAIVHGDLDQCIPVVAAELLLAALPYATRLAHPSARNDFDHAWFDVPDTASWVQNLAQWLD